MSADSRSNEDIIADALNEYALHRETAYWSATKASDAIVAALSAARRHIVEVGEWVIPVDGGEPEPLDEALIRRGLHVTEDGEAVIDGQRGRLSYVTAGPVDSINADPRLTFTPHPVSPGTDRP